MTRRVPDVNRGQHTPPRTTPTAAEVAARIHDDVLQSLGAALLQSELCQRLWELGQPEQALGELGDLTKQLESAVDALREIMNELMRATLDEPPA